MVVSVQFGSCCFLLKYQPIQLDFPPQWKHFLSFDFLFHIRRRIHAIWTEINYLDNGFRFDEIENNFWCNVKIRILHFVICTSWKWINCKIKWEFFWKWNWNQYWNVKWKVFQWTIRGGEIGKGFNMDDFDVTIVTVVFSLPIN